ncbi:hypothetical protein RVIR1_10200 [Candidatus Rickettsiella viridis]|uniref:Uncharacterized protein n=1 Tax=Candidatus Rickettsiella viridis TaxID=676208 RepID=A0A2Z5V4Y6_9COXI|nr:hypothetical protein [Candidatus Rickettsiella viridis]BBB15492.1 hypothetical protein RVIR1_10200 [Candidatus Rickettsiella viridis]
MGYDSSLYGESNTKAPEFLSFEKSYYSKEQYDLIKKSCEEIKKITGLLSRLNRINNLQYQLLRKQLDNIEKEFIIYLHRIIDHEKIAKIHSQSVNLLHCMFRANLFTISIIMTIIIATLLLLPITQLVTISLSAIIINTLILFQINAILLKDESPVLPAIKNTIALSIAQLDRLIEASTQLCKDIFFIIVEDVDQDESKKMPYESRFSNNSGPLFLPLSLSEKRFVSVPSLSCDKDIQTITNDNIDDHPLYTSTP